MLTHAKHVAETSGKMGLGIFNQSQSTSSLHAETKPVTISVISNKGGVGKTHFSINMASALAQTGANVLLIDGDLGNADISNKLGIVPKHTLLDFLQKDQQIQDLIVATTFQFDLICSAAGDFRLANLHYAQKTKFIRYFLNISQRYDFVIFDLGAGISRTVLDFALAADHTVIVTTPVDLISGYACSKASFFRFKEIEERLEGKLRDYKPQWSFAPMFVLNQARNLEQGLKLYNTIRNITNEHINAIEERFHLCPQYLGAIPFDRTNFRAVELSRKPLLFDFPYSKVTQCIQHMAKKFGTQDRYNPRIKLKSPWRRFVSIFCHKI